MVSRSLCLSVAILAQKLNTFILEKLNLILWHPWDPWERVHIDLNKNIVRTGCVQGQQALEAVAASDGRRQPRTVGRRAPRKPYLAAFDADGGC